MREDAERHERDFWDEAVPSLDACLDAYYRGPDPNTKAVLDAVEPLVGASVLDFACGGGVTSAWLAARGARVVGLDMSPKSVQRAVELCDNLGLDVTFVAGQLGEVTLPVPAFDRIIGRYALHHVDIKRVGPLLAALLKPAGRAAFLETMSTNPILRIARKHLVGRFGIPRFGTLDEHPLTFEDLELLRATFGDLQIQVPDLVFFRILDRQVFRFRSRVASKLLAFADDLLRRIGLDSLSYHQVLTSAPDLSDVAAYERRPVEADGI